MAISGHDSPQTVINSTGNTQTHSGNVAVSSASEFVVVVVSAWDAAALEDPSNWTVTLGGGSALTATQTTVSAGIDFAAATYEIASPPTGTPALAVDLGGAGRGCIAVAWVISGHDSGTPVSGRGTNTGYASDITSLAFSRTTTRDGNALLSAIGMREGALASEIGLSGGTLSTAVQTGTGATSDISGAWGHHVVATAGSTTDTYSWTTGARAHAHWVEINVATGGTTDGAGASAGAATASATGASTAAASGSATGAGGASSTGASTAAASGSAAGAATATGISGGGTIVSGSGASFGSATAASVGTGIIGRAGASSGVASVTAVGRSFVAVVGSAGGVAIVSASAASISAMVGTASGIASAIGLTADLSGKRARYPAASANTVTVHSETRQSALIGTTRTVRIV